MPTSTSPSPSVSTSTTVATHYDQRARDHDDFESEAITTTTSSIDDCLDHHDPAPGHHHHQTGAPAFQSSISTVTAADLHASWRSGCPLDVTELRAVSVSHWGYDGKVRTGRLIVAANLAEEMVAIMRDLYEARFPIQRMEPVDAYGGDDDASMAANNTSAFNCRAVTGGSSWSEHSYGRAIDVNPLVNPYVRGSTVLPPAGSQYADRGLDAPGMIHGGDEVVDAFAARGWKWGGYWDSPTDYQHFSTTGR